MQQCLFFFPDTPVLHLGIRIMSTTQTPKGSPVLTILDSTRRIYQSLVKNLIVQYKVYAVVSNNSSRNFINQVFQ